MEIGKEMIMITKRLTIKRIEVRAHSGKIHLGYVTVVTYRFLGIAFYVKEVGLTIKDIEYICQEK